jgi:hypothetical protein
VEASARSRALSRTCASVSTAAVTAAIDQGSSTRSGGAAATPAVTSTMAPAACARAATAEQKCAA